MMHGNHNKRMGDVVTVARWDEHLMRAVHGRYLPPDPGAMRFYVARVDYQHRAMALIPVNVAKHGKAYFVISLDDTNLIRVGRMQ